MQTFVSVNPSLENPTLQIIVDKLNEKIFSQGHISTELMEKASKDYFNETNLNRMK